jgi:hypothetical protein
MVGKSVMWFPYPRAWIWTALLLAWMPVTCAADEKQIEEQFLHSIQPFLKTYCIQCHDSESAEAKLDLAIYKSTGDIANAFPLWEHVVSRLKANEMPPADATPLPSAEERNQVVAWVQAFRRQEGLRNAGDPGVVLVRRLSNAEYNYSVRDLTGVDIKPTRDFPVDPANEAGFDNSGESLSMSPALFKKYLEAARMVSEHLVLTPKGFSFASHPAVTETDRDKYCVNRIIQFYNRQRTDLADYFYAAWQVSLQDPAIQDPSTMAKFALSRDLSPKYMSEVWHILTDSAETLGPLGHLQQLWNKLPRQPNRNEQARTECMAMRDFVVNLRRKLEPKIENLAIPGIHKGSQPFVLWKNDQYAQFRRSFDSRAVSSETDACLKMPDEAELKAQFDAALVRFCRVFPDAFYVSERGRDYEGKPKEQQEKGRLLSAGFHSMMGYYRDDAPLCDLILSESEKQELDELWKELDFVTKAPMRQYAGFVWFERTDSPYMRDAEFDFARAEDKSVTSESMIRKLANVYLEKAKTKVSEGVAIHAIEDFFERMNQKIRWIEQARMESEPRHLESLAKFASKAWRRELSPMDLQQIDQFYRSLRKDEGLVHEDAIQDSLVAILMSPHFCYRVEYAMAGAERRPLNDIELASRLSYFLWSSIPDHTLLDRAAAGELRDVKVLVSEAERMLQDSRARSLAIEFGANWLDFRRFDEHNSVDRNRFPDFTDELRQAMFEEPIQFFMDLVQRDGSVLDILYAKHTFVNGVLARHYGMSFPISKSANEWIRIDDAIEYGRGGLLPMSAFLTKNAPGLRTSPVKRGYWVVRRLLGETIPAPPPNVPELPSDESRLGERSLRDTLAKHREHIACSGCHNRIDSMGLVFEGYGPVGERREKDLGGRDVDTLAEFPDGSQGRGLEGLRNYIQRSRQHDFLDNLCRKLLCFALGRSLLLSDDPLVEELLARLESENYRFSTIIKTIITSQQFLEKRGDSSPIIQPTLKP